jgi:hypothetical protein
MNCLWRLAHAFSCITYVRVHRISLAAYCDGYGGLVTAQILYIARCCLSLPALHELVSSAHALVLIRQVL